MTRSASAVFSEALALPEKKRAELAERLLRSLDGPEPSGAEQAEIDAAWDREIERRMRRMEEGKTQLIPAEEVFAEAEQVVRKVRVAKRKKA